MFLLCITIDAHDLKIREIDRRPPRLVLVSRLTAARRPCSSSK